MVEDGLSVWLFWDTGVLGDEQVAAVGSLKDLLRR